MAGGSGRFWREGEPTGVGGRRVRAFGVQTEARLHPPPVLLPSPPHAIQTHTCKTAGRSQSLSVTRLELEEQQELQRVARLRGPTLPHHPGLQTLAEAAGLARFPPPLGDLALVAHGAAVLNVA